jgi:capsid protein
VLIPHEGRWPNTWSGGAAAAALDYDRLPADSVIHWFRTDRPGQRQGLPDILPALPLFAQLRRYTLAVIAGAESAANIAVLMKTNPRPAAKRRKSNP